MRLSPSAISPPDVLGLPPCPCATPSNRSPPRSRSCSLRISPTSTGPCSRSRTCPRRSRERFSPATRGTRGHSGACIWTSSLPMLPPGGGPSTGPRASAPRSSMSASSSASGTTRSRSSAAPTSPASGSATCSPRSCSAAGSPPTWSSRPATSPTTRRCTRAPSRGRRVAGVTTATSELGPEYGVAMDEIFSIYSRSLERVGAWAEQRWPRGDEPEAAWRRSIRAKALDLLRGLLPASTLSHVGIYASGQAYEGLIMRLAASPLPEARDFGEQALRELKLVIPSFLTRARATRARRRVDRLLRRAPGDDRALGLAARARPARGRERSVCRARPRRRLRGRSARRLTV